MYVVDWRSPRPRPPLRILAAIPVTCSLILLFVPPRYTQTHEAIRRCEEGLGPPQDERGGRAGPVLGCTVSLSLFCFSVVRLLLFGGIRVEEVGDAYYDG